MLFGMAVTAIGPTAVGDARKGEYCGIVVPSLDPTKV